MPRPKARIVNFRITSAFLFMFLLSGCGGSENEKSIQLLEERILDLKIELRSTKQELSDEKESQGAIRNIFYNTEKADTLEEEISSIEDNIEKSQEEIETIKSGQNSHGFGYYLLFGVLSIIALIALVALVYAGAVAGLFVAIVAAVAALGWVASLIDWF